MFIIQWLGKTLYAIKYMQILLLTSKHFLKQISSQDIMRKEIRIFRTLSTSEIDYSCLQPIVSQASFTPAD